MSSTTLADLVATAASAAVSEALAAGLVPSAPAKPRKAPAKKAAAKKTAAKKVAAKKTSSRVVRKVGAAKVSSKVITKGTRSAFVKDNPAFAGKATHEIRDLVAAGAKVNGGWHLPSGHVKALIEASKA